MEFFHSADVMKLAAPQRYHARRQLWNVCDMVFFELLVVKHPCNSNGMKERMVNMENSEPVEVTLRRLREQTEIQLVELDEREAERQNSEISLQQVKDTNAHLERLIEAERQHHLAEMSTRQAELDQARKESEEKSSSIQELEEILVKAKSEEEALQAQLASTQAALQSQRTASQLDLQSTQQTAAQQATRYEQTIGEYQRIGRNVALQLDEQRRRLVFRVISRLRDRTQLLSHVPAGLQQLVDDSFIFNQKLDGFLLQPSISLHAVPFIPYHIRPGRSGWRGVLLAGVLDVPLVEGYLGVEIVSAKQEIVAQVTIPAIQVASYLPIRLEFAPLAESATGDFELRVFGRNLDAPLRMLEWRHYRLGGLLPTRCKPFLGLIF
jgi:hypothetical protein